MDTNTEQAAIATGESLAAALAPLAGPEGILADDVLTGIVNIALSYQQKQATGQPYTLADLNAAVAKTDADISALAQDLSGGGTVAVAPAGVSVAADGVSSGPLGG